MGRRHLHPLGAARKGLFLGGHSQLAEHDVFQSPTGWTPVGRLGFRVLSAEFERGHTELTGRGSKRLDDGAASRRDLVAPITPSRSLIRAIRVTRSIRQDVEHAAQVVVELPRAGACRAATGSGPAAGAHRVRRSRQRAGLGIPPQRDDGVAARRRRTRPRIVWRVSSNHGAVQQLSARGEMMKTRSSESVR